MPRNDLLRYERLQWQCDIALVAGVDEAGRGPLAGPVVAAAVVLPAALAEEALTGALADLTDSKQLRPDVREHFFQYVSGHPEIAVGIGLSEAAEIDRVNILRATHLAMGRAVEALGVRPGHILVDGLPVKGFPVASTAIVKGDALSLSIAAASVVAKVTRDRIMVDLDGQYPGYGFAQHKGYGTAYHMQALLELGVTPVHRTSFRPVREAQAIRAGRDSRQPEFF